MLADTSAQILTTDLASDTAYLGFCASVITYASPKILTTDTANDTAYLGFCAGVIATASPQILVTDSASDTAYLGFCASVIIPTLARKYLPQIRPVIQPIWDFALA